ncbi:MAG: hypothetical protein CMD35_03765 [Flavobacteriales bacterium]|nr:hypothetical protein [Flavobacteriales bacterium]
MVGYTLAKDLNFGLINIGDENIAEPMKDRTNTIISGVFHLHRTLKISSFSKYFFIFFISYN